MAYQHFLGHLESPLPLLSWDSYKVIHFIHSVRSATDSSYAGTNVFHFKPCIFVTIVRCGSNCLSNGARWCALCHESVGSNIEVKSVWTGHRWSFTAGACNSRTWAASCFFQSQQHSQLQHQQHCMLTPASQANVDPHDNKFVDCICKGNSNSMPFLFIF